MSLTYNEQMQRIVSDYRRQGGEWPTTTRSIAAWAISGKLWLPRHEAMISECAEDLSRAMREEYVTDPQGRRVRAKHAARISSGGEQTVLWADIRTAEPKHMQIAFQQRRRQIVGDCKHLKTDVDSYNDNASPPEPITMVWDFTDDLAEAEIAEDSIE